jgi:hypothetical protein
MKIIKVGFSLTGASAAGPGRAVDYPSQGNRTKCRTNAGILFFIASASSAIAQISIF